MKRMAGLVSDKLVSPCTHENIRGLNGNHQIVIAHIFDELYLLKCRFHNALCRHMTAVLFDEILFQRSGIHSHTDGNVVGFSTVNNSLYLFIGTDVARVYTDLVGTVFHGVYGHLVIKMDIRHDGDMHLLLYLLKGQCCLICGDSASDYLAACFFKPQYLIDSCFYIFCFCIAHGLDRNGIVPPDLYVSNVYNFSVLSW